MSVPFFQDEWFCFCNGGSQSRVLHHATVNRNKRARVLLRKNYNAADMQGISRSRYGSSLTMDLAHNQEENSSNDEKYFHTPGSSRTRTLVVEYCLKMALPISRTRLRTARISTAVALWGAPSQPPGMGASEHIVKVGGL